ncbi:MAG: lipopolysaccharide biosynthesis protein, partial [Chitinophagaceae bacterium]
MASLKKNIVANIIGKFWSAAVVLLLIPLYIRYLGIESYGLIGFYGTLIGSMAILDLGLSTTLNRELARYKGANIAVGDIRNLTFSLECIYWGIGLFISLIIILLAGPIASNWVNAENLSFSVVKQSIIYMGIVIAFQWPISMYGGGLTGLEKQVLNNTINVIMSTLR